MLKKLGINTKDTGDTPPSSSSPTSPGLTRSKGVDRDKEKRKAAHNKTVLRTSSSIDSIDSPSLAPRPHLPSSIYNPNPFPLDPTQPDGVSRINQFVRKEHEIETTDVDIEIEEMRGFMTGKEKARPGRDDVDDDVEYELAKKGNTMQKIGAGLKGFAFPKGLGKSKDKDKEDKDAIDPQHRQQQQQRRQSVELETASRQMAARGRPRERARTQSGSGSGKDPFTDPRSRVQSLSPPPLPGQEHRHSGYWPEGEQSRPFLGYQPSSSHPPLSPSSQARAAGRYPRPSSQHSDSDYSDYARQAIDSSGRYRSRERDPDRRDGPGGLAGVRRSGLNHVTNATSVHTSSEYDDEERSALSSGGGGDRRPTRAPDRLSRAKDWVASHSKNNSLANPDARERDRGTGLDESSSTPGAFPIASASRPNHRLSMDSDDYALITPPRGSYLSGAGGGYDSRERMAMLSQMQMQGLQRNRNSMDDGGYWSHQLDGYGRDRDRDRYRNSRPQDYEFDHQQGPGGGFYGYQPGGPDDDVEEDAESTLAPGSATGVPGKAKKVADKKEAQGVNGGEAPKDEEAAVETTPKAPNKRRLTLRLISLGSSFLVLLFLIAAAPVSKMSAPFDSKAGLATHYIVAILSTLVSCAFVFNYFSRRLRRREKMKRYVMFGLDIFMTLAWMIDVFVCISKFPCAVGGQGGWCDMYNTSVFLGIVALLSFLAAFVWDIWGSFDHSNLIGKRPLIKPAPPGFYKNDKRAMAAQGAYPARAGGVLPGALPGQPGPGAFPGQLGMPGWPGPGAFPGQPGLPGWPGQRPGQFPGMGRGGPGMKNPKALW
ncbi:hypothetical protein MVEG_10559 [Podila verticillata NRRL 6337]|nr:hypothetical protein MVEG_10559 [Podila verticillata NRRL 6337]